MLNKGHVEIKNMKLISVSGDKVIAGIISVPLPASMQSEFNTWSDGFDSATRDERSGRLTECPFIGQQAELWQQGYSASQRVTEIGRGAV